MWCCVRNFENKIRLDGKTAIITGGNSGIGKETANDLYKRGAKVVILSRNEQKSKAAIDEIKSKVKQINKNHDIRSKCLDLSDLSSVRKCAEELLQEEDQINILINNAGVMGNPTKISKDGFEIHFAANYLGHFLLTLLLLPRLISSGPARIINVSSSGHNYAGINKVTVYSLHPGIIATNLFENWNMFLWGLAWFWGRFLATLFCLNAEQGSRTTLYCALDESLANQSGLYYSNCAEYSPNRLAHNTEVAKDLWEKSIEFTGLKDYDPFKKNK